MNFTWCGQSCGSTSRLFLHESIHDRVLKEIVGRAAHFKPGIPTDPRTTMGAIISRAQLDKILGYIRIAAEQGARLVYGGNRPSDPALADGFFVEPTIFADVTQDMRIAREEVFGPVLAVLKWRDEDEMLRQVNSVEYGLTAAIFTRDLATAHRAAARVDAGYVWVNSVGAHFLGAGFGGVKQSGMGREESVEELVSFTQAKNIHVTL
jgi:betaine-aldehyde dehydrogenase